jgi:hypothetical protein
MGVFIDAFGKNGGPVINLDADARRFFVGPFGWLFEDRRYLAEPVPCRGYQGLWTPLFDEHLLLEEHFR